MLKITSLDLLACHMVGDYITQTSHMAAHKLTDAKIRAKHVTVYTAGFLLPVLPLSVSRRKKAAFLAAVWITHFITDSRRWASGEEWPPKPILVDQSIHLATLAVLRRLLVKNWK